VLCTGALALVDLVFVHPGYFVYIQVTLFTSRLLCWRVRCEKINGCIFWFTALENSKKYVVVETN
jgi:hypothetical protein